jgi:octaprenyl-diphosphate synthase
LADIKEKKLTLPLIHALGQVSWLERRRWIGLIKGQPADPRNVTRIVEFIESSGGLAYARRVMQGLVEKGQRQLESFPAGSARDSLGALLVFAAERDH